MDEKGHEEEEEEEELEGEEEVVAQAGRASSLTYLVQ